MKILKTKMLVAALLISVSAAFAQSPKIESGTIPSMKGEKKLKLVYNYKEMDMGKYGNEEEYTKKKVADLNAKSPGKGDKWLEGWNGNRTMRYHPKFEEQFVKALTKVGCDASEKADGAKYTLVVKTITLYPGYNIGVSKIPAYCTYRFDIVETASPDKVLTSILLNHVAGSQAMGFDFDEGSRVAESYAKAGKIMGKFLAKKAFK